MNGFSLPYSDHYCHSPKCRIILILQFLKKKKKSSLSEPVCKKTAKLRKPLTPRLPALGMHAWCNSAFHFYASVTCEWPPHQDSRYSPLLELHSSRGSVQVDTIFCISKKLYFPQNLHERIKDSDGLSWHFLKPRRQSVWKTWMKSTSDK